MKRINYLIFLLGLILLTGCQQDNPDGLYYPFKNHVWKRFNILNFDIPVERSERPYTIVFFARHNGDFPYKSLDFNMIMNTPSGEERIREFQLKIRNANDKFLGKCELEICEVTIVLNKELYISKDGILLIEFENLIPRMETPGLLGVGIRIKQD
jgi:gliding motility-associated lipoprotein GldH